MMQNLQAKKSTVVIRNVAGFTVTLQRFNALHWSVKDGDACYAGDAFEVAEFIHAQQK